MAQHLIQVGTLEVSTMRMQVQAVERPTAIPVSSVVEVSWSHADISKEILKNYLENQKRSSGGHLKDLRFYAEKRKAYVTFVDTEGNAFCVLF